MEINGTAALAEEEVFVNEKANGMVEDVCDVEANNWSKPGPAAFDFRSEYFLRLCHTNRIHI